jgi:hypothetical protein
MNKKTSSKKRNAIDLDICVNTGLINRELMHIMTLRIFFNLEFAKTIKINPYIIKIQLHTNVYILGVNVST